MMKVTAQEAQEILIKSEAEVKAIEAEADQWLRAANEASALFMAKREDALQRATAVRKAAFDRVYGK